MWLTIFFASLLNIFFNVNAGGEKVIYDFNLMLHVIFVSLLKFVALKL